MDNDRMAEYQYMQRQESEDEPLKTDREKAMEALRSKLSVKLSDPPTEHEALGMAVSAILTHVPHSELTGENYTEPYSNTTKLGAALWQTHIIASERLNGRQVEPEAGYEPISEHQALGLAIGALKQLPDYPVTEWYAGGHSSTHALLPALEVVYKDAEAHKSPQHIEYKPPEKELWINIFDAHGEETAFIMHDRDSAMNAAKNRTFPYLFTVHRNAHGNYEEMNFELEVSSPQPDREIDIEPER